jgi:threonine/homoserine/homoserine lactone efflux protein
VDALIGIQPATFLVASVLLIMLPGPDMAIVARNTIAHGQPAGLRTAFGSLAGISLHTALSVVGVSAILAASATAFTVVKLVGAAYLVLIGLRVIAGTLRGRGVDHEETPFVRAAIPLALTPSSPFVQGLLSSTLNPKLAVFFLTFLPQFVDPDRMPRLGLATHGAIFVALTLAWLWIWVRALDRLASSLRRPAVRLWAERAIGGAVLGLGVRLALERR